MSSLADCIFAVRGLDKRSEPVPADDRAQSDGMQAIRGRSGTHWTTEPVQGGRRNEAERQTEQHGTHRYQPLW